MQSLVVIVEESIVAVKLKHLWFCLNAIIASLQVTGGAVVGAMVVVVVLVVVVVVVVVVAVLVAVSAVSSGGAVVTLGVILQNCSNVIRTAVENYTIYNNL